MVDGIVAYSELNNPNDAMEDVLKQISIKGDPLLIIFHSSPETFRQHTERFSKAFPKAEIMGCTTSMELSSKGNGKKSLVAWTIMSGVECASGVLLEIASYPKRYSESIEKAVGSLNGTDNTVCIDFNTSGENCEELIQDTFRDILEPINIPVVGGTAGAEGHSEPTFVSLNGTVYDEATVFLVIRNLEGKIFAYKENIFKPTKKMTTATDVDCEARVVYEFECLPAADVMAFMLNTTREDLFNVLKERPLGRITGKDIYLTDMKEIREDGSIEYFARIYNQTRVVIMEPDVPESVWKQTAAAVKAVLLKPSITYCVQCATRVTYLENHGKLDDFSEAFKNEYGQYAGFVGLGEQFNYEHFNDTMVMVVFE